MWSSHRVNACWYFSRGKDSAAREIFQTSTICSSLRCGDPEDSWQTAALPSGSGCSCCSSCTASTRSWTPCWWLLLTWPAVFSLDKKFIKNLENCKIQNFFFNFHLYLASCKLLYICLVWHYNCELALSQTL